MQVVHRLQDKEYVVEPLQREGPSKIVHRFELLHIARAAQPDEESVLLSTEETDQSENLISFAGPDVSVQQRPLSYADREPGMQNAGEQQEEHPIPERNRMQSRHSSRRNAGVHSNPHHLPKTVVQSEVALKLNYGSLFCLYMS